MCFGIATMVLGTITDATTADRLRGSKSQINEFTHF